MREALLIDAVRTPIGRRNGKLKAWHAVDLLAHTLRMLVLRNQLDPGHVDDVMAGCVTQVGEQSLNVARNAVLAAGFPESVPGTTIDRQCGSSQQALHFAAQSIKAGVNNLVIACGVESMSRVPLGSSSEHGPGTPFGSEMRERYGDGLIHQGLSAERIARKWQISRLELDEYSLQSHMRAARATREGRFKAEILEFPLGTEGQTDEGIRFDTSLEKLQSLKPAFEDGGSITAGNASQISDGASAVLVADKATAEALGLRPRARIVAMEVAGDDPILMLTAPIPATARVLKRAGLSLNDMDRIEINEAFASVVLAWQRETGADLDRVNVNGGAIALGHPLGASGTRLTATLLHELEYCGGRFGLQTMCEGGGMANATVIERIN